MSSTQLATPELRYEAITWKYVEGNIISRDTWNERATAWEVKSPVSSLPLPSQADTTPPRYHPKLQASRIMVYHVVIEA
ncbi:UNVERIFIED_ORG: hypothetical protein C7429_102307 [Pantoea allii]